MSEYGFEDSIVELDEAFSNPELTQVLDEAALYQDIIDGCDTSVDEKDIWGIVSLLDEKWPYMDQEVTITGNVHMPVQTDPQDVGVFEIEPTFIEDKTVQSLGFDVIKMTVLSDYGKYERYVLGLLFGFNPELVSKSKMLDSFLLKRAHAEPSNVIITPPHPGEIQLFDQLHYFSPEIAQDIDTSILNANSESAAVMSLSSLRIPRVKDRVPTDLQLVTNYINSRIDFDRVVPYSMKFGGLCQVIDGEGGAVLAYAKPGITLAVPLWVELIADHRITGSKDDLVPGLRIMLVEEAKEKDTAQQYIVPITDDFCMDDMRTIMYPSINLAI